MKSFVLLFLLGCCSTLAFAQDPADDGSQDDGSLDFFDDDTEVTDDGWSQFTVSLGYMWLEAAGQFDVVGPRGNRVTVIDLDRLGVDDKDGSLWATFNWRSRSSNWGAWFGHWSFSGAGFRIWEEELETGDGVIVPVGAAVGTEITTDWYILEATYSFVQNDTWDAGVGVGFHVVDIETTLAVGGRVGEEERATTVANLDTLAPLPNVLGYVHFRLGERWRVTARYGWFGLSYDKYDGQMTNFHGLLRYDLTDRWALEAGYQFVKLDVDVTERSYTGLFDMDFDGPMAVVRFNF